MSIMQTISRTAVAGTAALALALTIPAGTSQALSAPTAAPVVAASSTDARAQVAAVVEGSPASAGMTAEEKAHIVDGFITLAQEVDRASKAGQSHGGALTADWNIGLGYWVYVHHITPEDQRFFLQAGVVAVSAAICAASIGTVCAVAGPLASALEIAISEYYSSDYCLELEFDYGILVGGSPTALHNAYWTNC